MWSESDKIYAGAARRLANDRPGDFSLGGKTPWCGGPLPFDLHSQSFIVPCLIRSFSPVYSFTSCLLVDINYEVHIHETVIRREPAPVSFFFTRYRSHFLEDSLIYLPLVSALSASASLLHMNY